MSTPLAELMRPMSLSEVIGQDALISQNSLLKHLYDNKEVTSMILWGPPGTGKTTLARILAQNSSADFIELSAVTSGIADVRKVTLHAEANQRLGQQTVLFVDEIHRFSKSQQDAFLPYIEKGTITLIGATTENPSFEVINPLLSRSRVVVLQKLSKESLVEILNNALAKLKKSKSTVTLKNIELIASLADGGARRALGILELSLKVNGKKVSSEIIAESAQRSLVPYDKNGEMHYDLISAFIKSMRGSDVNASLYYAARILAGGEDPKFLARRMVVFASEDIGIASSPALNLAVGTFLAVERIGMPECEYNIFHCVTVLAASKKSRKTTDAMNRAKQAAAQYGNVPVPLHLRNAPTKLMSDLGYGKDYKWQADFKHADGFMPTKLKDLTFFD